MPTRFTSAVRVLIAGAAMFSTAQAATADDFLLVPNSNTDTIEAFDAFSGAALGSFINHGAALGQFGYTGSSTPIEAIEVGNEIWVSDQLADRIVRYNKFTSQAVGQIGVNALGDGQFNNIRGISLIGNKVYAALGSSSDTFDEGIVEIDSATGAVITSFNGRDSGDTSYWDIISLDGNELLITNSDTGNDGIERYNLAGNYLGNLFSSDGASSLDFGQQMNIRGTTGNILVGGFSPPAGVYEITPGGVDLGIVAAMDLGPRAGYELGNGQIAWSNGAQFGTDAAAFGSGSFRFINASTVPAPGAAAVLGLAALSAGRRRR